MWCHWCRKANHSDAQCFSTRPAGWTPKSEDAEPRPTARYIGLMKVKFTGKEVTLAALTKRFELNLG